MTPAELAAEFPLGPDSLPQPGVPKGTVEKFVHAHSAIFPGTVRGCWIYVPAQYDAAVPACVMIVQDGADHLKPERRWHIPTVLDNLIHRGEMPVTIGVFIDPGVIPAEVPGAAPRLNRSFEYNSPGDRYARFLLEEILPVVESRYRLRRDGNSRCVMGGSSGAFCAFNAAWERPDDFRRVISIVGSYTALRGGNALPPLVRLTEPKPLRVFLQSGENDLRVASGDWWTANLEMNAALEYAGYEVEHRWAVHAGHDEFHGSMVFPEAVRWVWRGYPADIATGIHSRQPLARVLFPGEGWEEVGGDHPAATRLAGDPSGNVYFVNLIDEVVYRVDSTGRAARFGTAIRGVGGLAAGADGRVYLTDPARRRILALTPEGRVSVAMDRIEAQGVDVSAFGVLYATEPTYGRIWLLPPGGTRAFVDTPTQLLHGVRIAPDQGHLLASDRRGMFGQIFTVQPNGGVHHGAPHARLHGREGTDDFGSGELAISRGGWSVFATRLGLQVVDVTGTVVGIIPMPRSQAATGVAFGGASGDVLFASAGGKLYRRKIRVPSDLWC